ncbi:lipoate--protein ligase family protein [Tundrisphaera lichenicola]|uniref:lipoate--protein ligase family protein n=1 Tax=Tundrisphaera lichenicola TaxID=2029860 RepID=UPI003EBDDD21
MNWPIFRYLDITLATVGENLALDEALLLEAEERGGPALLRVWELDHLAIVLGASGRINEDVRREACEADGVPIARRSSGGGTVVIGPGALNFTIVMPIDSAPELRTVDQAQRLILERTAQGLRVDCPSVEVLGSGDLTLGDRKFSGSAQRRLRRNLLVHASLLYDFPLDRVEQYTRQPSRKPDYRRNRSHADFLTNIPISRERLLKALKIVWLEDDPGSSSPTIPEDIVQKLLVTKFSKVEWIERL